MVVSPTRSATIDERLAASSACSGRPRCMLRPMRMSRLLGCIWSTVLVVVVTGCGSGQATGAEGRCFGGGIYDRVATDSGEATPGAAVRALAHQKEAAIKNELATIAATEERDRRLAEDRAAVRGLRALQSVADAAEGAGTLEATAEEGDVVASADLIAAPAGGFFISSLRAEADCEAVS